MDIPSDAVLFIQVSNDFAFYLTILSFLGSGALSFIGLREITGHSEKTVSIDVPIPVTAVPVEQIKLLPSEAEKQLLPQTDFSDFVNLPTVEPLKPPPPAGAKLCPSCGSIVSVYQTKCIKCGGKIKPGK